MRRHGTVLLAGAGLAAVLVAGCTAPGPAPRPEQERVIAAATPEQVLAEATAILRREFGRVHVNAEARQVTTDPVEFSTERESGTVRDLYRGRSVMRRAAHFQVGQRGGTTVARLRVDVERQDTERRAAVPPAGSRLSDLPGQDTPIDRDAATTAEQNTVWTFVRRDTRLASALLEELQDHFARQTADAETQPARP